MIQRSLTAASHDAPHNAHRPGLALPSRTPAAFDPGSVESPPDFLEQLAQHLKTVPALVPPARATEELIAWIERETAARRRPSDPFFHVAARLIYEETRLVLPLDGGYRHEMACLLRNVNRNRAQAKRWDYTDWLRLADIVLAHRRLPLVALFSDDPPSPNEVVLQIELPYAARFVDKPPKKGVRTLRAAPLEGLFERAQVLLAAVSADVKAAQDMLAPLQTERKRIPSRPAASETSASPARKRA